MKELELRVPFIEPGPVQPAIDEAAVETPPPFVQARQGRIVIAVKQPLESARPVAVRRCGPIQELPRERVTENGLQLVVRFQGCSGKPGHWWPEGPQKGVTRGLWIHRGALPLPQPQETPPDQPPAAGGVHIPPGTPAFAEFYL